MPKAKKVKAEKPTETAAEVAVDEAKAAQVAALQAIPESARTDEDRENLTNLLAS